MADIDSHVTVTVRAFRVTNGCMDDWDVRPPCFVSKPAVNNAALTLGGVLPPSRSFIDRGQPRLPLSLPGGLRAAGDSESPAAYATRMKALEQEVRARLHAAQRERTGKAALDPGRVDRTVTFQVGDRAGEARCGPRTRSCSTPPWRARRPRWGGPCTAAAAAGITPSLRPRRAASSAVPRATSAGSSRTTLARPGPTRAPLRGRRGRRRQSGFSTVSLRPSVAGPATWFACRAALALIRPRQYS